MLKTNILKTGVKLQLSHPDLPTQNLDSVQSAIIFRLWSFGQKPKEKGNIASRYDQCVDLASSFPGLRLTITVKFELAEITNKNNYYKKINLDPCIYILSLTNNYKK